MRAGNYKFTVAGAIEQRPCIRNELDGCGLAPLRVDTVLEDGYVCEVYCCLKHTGDAIATIEYALRQRARGV